jgi:hypothetical protein
MNILAIGTGGNLGSYFVKNSRHRHCISSTVRESEPTRDFSLITWDKIYLPEKYRPDFIINFANSYYPSPNAAELRSMQDAIVGVAHSIFNTNLNFSAPIIAFSSYFQYAPIEMHPWSQYSILKDESFQIYESMNSTKIELTLRDNYGGNRKDKFFDVALLANKNGSQLSANPGESIINLLHLSDICNGIDSVIDNLASGTNSAHFEFKARESHTLRNLVRLIDELSLKETSVNWGAYPYRDKEVFEEWECAPTPPGWFPKVELADFIRNFLI